MRTLASSARRWSVRDPFKLLEGDGASSPEEKPTKPGLRSRLYSSGFLLFLFLSLTIAGYLYLSLFVLPNFPILQGDDQVYFWMDAQRMLHGERAYLDFFQYTPPGTDIVFLTLFKLFGARIWVLNAAVLALGVALCWICFTVASQLVERRLAVLATFLYLILIFSKPLNATHHWFSVLWVMCAAAVMLRMPETNPRRVATAGGLLGLASFFTHTHGAAALLAFVVFLIWDESHAGRPWRGVLARPLVLVFGFAAAVLA